MQALSGNVGDDRDSASIHLPVLGTSRVVIVIKVATIEFVHARHERSFEGQLRVGRHAVLRGVKDDANFFVFHPGSELHFHPGI